MLIPQLLRRPLMGARRSCLKALTAVVVYRGGRGGVHTPRFSDRNPKPLPRI